jgi:hypothetical protein
MPVPARARQARDLDPEHQPDVTEADLGHQALEARSVEGRGGGAAEIVIDDQDLLGLPAELVGAVRQGILQTSGFPVVLDLTQGGLTDVVASCDSAASAGRLALPICALNRSKTSSKGTEVLTSIRMPWNGIAVTLASKGIFTPLSRSRRLLQPRRIDRRRYRLLQSSRSAEPRQSRGSGLSLGGHPIFTRRPIEWAHIDP